MKQWMVVPSHASGPLARRVIRAFAARAPGGKSVSGLLWIALVLTWIARGSWRFIIMQAVIMVIWVTFNSVAWFFPEVRKRAIFSILLILKKNDTVKKVV